MKTRLLRRKVIKNILLAVFGLFVMLLIIFPIVWMLPSAFKVRSELFAIPNTFFPKNFTFDNFSKVFGADLNGSTFLKSMLVTFVVACLSTFFSLFVNMFAGYVFGRLEFRGKKVLWGYFLFSMFIPGITIMLTSIKVVDALSMIDTIFVLFVPGLANSYHIFFFRQFYFNIPVNIEEAATIDGANRFQIFFKIFLPMSKTPMIITGVGVFMGSWNSYIWPTLTITTNNDLTMVMQLIRTFSTTYSGAYGVVIAASILSLIVPIIIFAIFQKKIVAGIALTGGK